MDANEMREFDWAAGIPDNAVDEAKAEGNGSLPPPPGGESPPVLDMTRDHPDPSETLAEGSVVHSDDWGDLSDDASEFDDDGEVPAEFLEDGDATSAPPAAATVVGPVSGAGNPTPSPAPSGNNGVQATAPAPEASRPQPVRVISQEKPPSGQSADIPGDRSLPGAVQSAQTLSSTEIDDLAEVLETSRTKDRGAHWKAFDTLTAGMPEKRRSEIERLIANAGLLPSDPAIIAAVLLWRQDLAFLDHVVKFEKQGDAFLEMIPRTIASQVGHVLDDYSAVPAQVESAMTALRQVASMVERDAAETLGKAGKEVAKTFAEATEESGMLLAGKLDTAIRTAAAEFEKGRKVQLGELALSANELKTDIRKEVSRAAHEIAVANKTRSIWSPSNIAIVGLTCLAFLFAGFVTGFQVGESKTVSAMERTAPRR